MIVDPKEQSALSVLTEFTVYEEGELGSEDPFQSVYNVPDPDKSLNMPSRRGYETGLLIPGIL
jgi:hypothetical protein